jgi:hypothetical protein
MAQKKGGGSTRNGRDSQPKMLGVRSSYSTSPVSASVMMVPTGIFSTMSSPAAPNMSEPMPCCPRLASCRLE